MHTCRHADVHACIHAYVQTCRRAHMHTCIHAGMQTCIHAYMHTYPYYIQIHMLTLPFASPKEHLFWHCRALSCGFEGLWPLSSCPLRTTLLSQDGMGGTKFANNRVNMSSQVKPSIRFSRRTTLLALLRSQLWLRRPLAIEQCPLSTMLLSATLREKPREPALALVGVQPQCPRPLRSQESADVQAQSKAHVRGCPSVADTRTAILQTSLPGRAERPYNLKRL